MPCTGGRYDLRVREKLSDRVYISFLNVSRVAPPDEQRGFRKCVLLLSPHIDAHGFMSTVSKSLDNRPLLLGHICPSVILLRPKSFLFFLAKSLDKKSLPKCPLVTGKHTLTPAAQRLL